MLCLIIQNSSSFPSVFVVIEGSKLVELKYVFVPQKLL
jgi:hypothetical protein